MQAERGNHPSESGSATLELVVATPLLLLVVALVLQLGVLYHSQNVVTAAAQTGLEQARTETGTVKGGEDGALKFISVAAPDFIRKPVAQATVDDTQATVRVAGEAYPILPGLKLHVTAVATAPRERFVRGG